MACCSPTADQPLDHGLMGFQQMTLYLQNVTGGLPLTAANTLGTVVVTVQ